MDFLDLVEQILTVFLSFAIVYWFFKVIAATIGVTMTIAIVIASVICALIRLYKED